MSFTTIPNSVKLNVWAKQEWIQTTQRSVLGHMFNSGVVYRPSEFEGQRTGQTLTYTYIGKLMQAGLGEGSTLDGNEEALNIGDFSMRVGMTRLGVLNPNDEDTLESVQSNINFERVTRPLIMRSAVEKLDYSVFNQLAGVSPTSITLGGITYAEGGVKNNILNVTGQNPVIAPSAGRVLRAGGAANDQSITSSDKMTLSLIDYAVEMLSNSDQPVEFLDNGFMFELWISHEQFTDLKQDSDSPITWYNNVLAMASGGNSDALTGRNMFRNNLKPVGEYAGVQIFVSPRVAYGVNSGTNVSIPTVRRAVLVGRDALSYASKLGTGRPTDDKVPLVYKTQMKDYEYWKGIEGRLIYGLKKNTPSNGSDVGVVVISTYAGAHTS
jgi:hypothetical protein